MADLYIDGEMLQRTRRDFSRIEELMSRPMAMMRTMSTDEVGTDELDRELEDFADTWGYGVEQLGKFAAGAAEALESIAAAFDDADSTLASSLNSARTPSTAR